MNSTVSLSFRYLERDYVRALRAHYASRLRLRWDIVVAIVLAGCGAYLWQSPGTHWLGVGCMVVAGVFGAINLPSTGSWALLGTQLRRFLGDPAKLRVFNVTMALILVATLYPIVFATH